MPKHVPESQLLQQAKRIAKTHGMFITTKGQQHLLYRINPHGSNQLLGARTNAHGLHKLVERCAHVSDK